MHGFAHAPGQAGNSSQSGGTVRKILFAATLLSVMSFGFAASAQSPFDFDQPGVGKAANTFMVRLRAIGVIPLNSSSSITPIGGQVETTNQAAPEVDFSYFWTDNIAFELIAASTRHVVSAHDTAIGNLDVASTWVLPPTLTVQYHFMPHEAFSPYVGAGINGTFFYSSGPANAAVTHVHFDNNVGAAIQAGFDYNFGGHWFANFDVKQIFVNTTAHLETVLGPVTAKTALNPFVVGVGIGYRF
jgi:outer membrane protein